MFCFTKEQIQLVERINGLKNEFRPGIMICMIFTKINSFTKQTIQTIDNLKQYFVILTTATLQCIHLQTSKSLFQIFTLHIGPRKWQLLAKMH